MGKAGRVGEIHLLCAAGAAHGLGYRRPLPDAVLLNQLLQEL